MTKRRKDTTTERPCGKIIPAVKMFREDLELRIPFRWLYGVYCNILRGLVSTTAYIYVHRLELDIPGAYICPRLLCNHYLAGRNHLAVHRQPGEVNARRERPAGRIPAVPGGRQTRDLRRDRPAEGENESD